MSEQALKQMIGNDKKSWLCKGYDDYLFLIEDTISTIKPEAAMENWKPLTMTRGAELGSTREWREIT